MLFLPFVQIGTDIFEPLGGLGNFFSLGFCFLFISLLFESMSKNVEKLELHSCANLYSVSTDFQLLVESSSPGRQLPESQVQ
jgi:hypothetical protein